MLVLAWACSDDGGSTTPPENTKPNASFTTPSCVAGAPCTFTSTSTDDVAVTGWSWDFNGDGTADATTATAAYTFAAAGDYPVTLTVVDAAGLSDDVTTTVTVAGLPARIDFIGEPWGLAGVTLINYQIPPAAPLGPQQVIVTTGGIASAPATITITP